MLLLVEITREDAAVPLGTDDGVKAQLAPLGNPEQVSSTFGLNPKPRSTPIVALVELPAVTIDDANADTEIEKFGGVVFNSTPTALLSITHKLST